MFISVNLYKRTHCAPNLSFGVIPLGPQGLLDERRAQRIREEDHVAHEVEARVDLDASGPGQKNEGYEAVAHEDECVDFEE